MTIIRHVDYLKISHVDAWEITKVKVKRGKSHKYLGMDLNYEKPGHVCISMKDYIDKAIKDSLKKSGMQQQQP